MTSTSIPADINMQDVHDDFSQHDNQYTTPLSVSSLQQTSSRDSFHSNPHSQISPTHHSSATTPHYPSHSPLFLSHHPHSTHQPVYSLDDELHGGDLDFELDETSPLTHSHDDENSSFFRAYRDLDRPVQLSRPAFLFLLVSALMALSLSILAISGLSLQLDEDILHLFYGPGFQVGYQEFAITLDDSIIASSIALSIRLPIVSINSFELLYFTSHLSPYLPQNETAIPAFFLDEMDHYDTFSLIFDNEQIFQAYQGYSHQSDLAFQLQSTALHIIHHQPASFQTQSTLQYQGTNKQQQQPNVHDMYKYQGNVDSLNLDTVVKHLYNTYVSSYNYHTQLQQTSNKTNHDDILSTDMVAKLMHEERFASSTQIFESIDSLQYIELTSFQSLLYQINPNQQVKDQLKEQKKINRSTSFLSTLFSTLTASFQTTQSTQASDPPHQQSKSTTQVDDSTVPLYSYGHSVMIGWDGFPQVAAILEPYQICLIKCNDLICSSGKTLLFSLTTLPSNPTSQATTITTTPASTISSSSPPLESREMHSFGLFQSTSVDQDGLHYLELQQMLPHLSLRQTLDLSTFFEDLFETLNIPTTSPSHSHKDSHPKPVLETQQTTSFSHFSPFSSVTQQNDYLYKAIQELPSNIRTLSLSQPITRLHTSSTQDTIVTFTDVSGAIYVLACPDQYCFPAVDSRPITKSTLRSSIAVVRVASTALYTSLDSIQTPIGNHLIGYIDAISLSPKLISCLSATCDVNHTITVSGIHLTSSSRLKLTVAGDGNIIISTSGTCRPSPFTESSFISRYTTPNESLSLYRALIQNNIISSTTGLFIVPMNLQVKYVIPNPNYVDPNDTSGTTPQTSKIYETRSDIHLDMTNLDFTNMFQDAGLSFISPLLQSNPSQNIIKRKYYEVFNILFNAQNYVNNSILLKKHKISTTLLSTRNTIFLRCTRLDCLPGYITVSIPALFNPYPPNMDSQSAHPRQQQPPKRPLQSYGPIHTLANNDAPEYTLSGLIRGSCVDVTVSTGSGGYPLFLLLHQPSPSTQSLQLSTFLCSMHDCRTFVLENEDDGANYSTQSMLTYIHTGVGIAENLYLHSVGIESLTNRVQIRNSPYGAATTLIQFEHQGYAILAECSNAFCRSISINPLFMQLSPNGNFTIPYNPLNVPPSRGNPTSSTHSSPSNQQSFHSPQSDFLSYFKPFTSTSHSQESPHSHFTSIPAHQLNPASKNANRGICTVSPCGDVRISSVDGMPIVVFGTEYPYVIHCSNMICLPYIIH